MRRSATQSFCLSALALGLACESATRGDGGVGSDGSADSGSAEVLDVGGEHAIDVEVDADLDGARPARPGTMTLVATELEILTDRICDLDGDGVGDNAIADLGNPMAAVAAAGINASDYEAGSVRPILHFRCLEDQNGPSDTSFTLSMIVGRDTDLPADPSDDFSGAEPFYAIGGAGNLDGCGEPAFLFEGASLDDGILAEVEGRGVVVLLGEWMFFDRGRITGTFAPDGESGEARVCGYRRVSTIYDGGALEHLPPGLTPLEAFLAGGGPVGQPDMPGLTPDIDLDGDGLERFVLDEEWHIARCIDGDGTVLEGRDCFADPRVADAISFSYRMEMTSAVLGGREPRWEDFVVGTCDEPPAVSFFDPC